MDKLQMTMRNSKRLKILEKIKFLKKDGLRVKDIFDLRTIYNIDIHK